MGLTQHSPSFYLLIPPLSLPSSPPFPLPPPPPPPFLTHLLLPPPSFHLYMVYLPLSPYPLLPPAQDAVPVINQLQFDPMFQPALMQIFGKTLICRDMDRASQYAKNASLDCITLEGIIHVPYIAYQTKCRALWG